MCAGHVATGQKLRTSPKLDMWGSGVSVGNGGAVVGGGAVAGA